MREALAQTMVAACLVQSPGVAFIVLAGFYTLFPKMPVRGLSAAGELR